MARTALAGMVTRTLLTGNISINTLYYNHKVSNPLFIAAYQIGWLDYYIGNNGEFWYFFIIF